MDTQLMIRTLMLLLAFLCSGTAGAVASEKDDSALFLTPELDVPAPDPAVSVIAIEFEGSIEPLD